MNRALILAAMLAISPAAAAASEAKLPDLAKAMVDAAVKTGDPAQVKAVVSAASEVFPQSADAIAAYGAPIADGLEPPPPPPPPPADEPKINPTFGAWEGKIAGSAAVASGNSENTAVGFALEARHEGEKIAHNIAGYIDIGSTGGVQNLKRWGASYQLDYKFSERAYSFARFAYDEDQFSGFDYRLFAGAGAGYYIARSDPFTWKVEAGPGYRYSPVDDDRTVQKNFAVFASTDLDWTIREGLKFGQHFSATWTNPTTTLVSITSLDAALTSSLAAGLAYELRHETNPPLGRLKTDRLLRATISYSY